MNSQRGSNADRSSLVLGLADVDALVGRCGLLDPQLAVLNACPADRHLPVLTVPHQGRGRVTPDLAEQDNIVTGRHCDVIGLPNEVGFD